MPTITHVEVWAFILLALIVVLLVKACRFTWPDPITAQSYAALANTPGGLVLILLFLWVFTLVMTVVFCIWVLIRGIDPQNGIVILATGMLSSGAFSGVSGALFTRMTGQEPKLPGTPPSTTTTTITSNSTEPPKV